MYKYFYVLLYGMCIKDKIILIQLFLARSFWKSRAPQENLLSLTKAIKLMPFAIKIACYFVG